MPLEILVFLIGIALGRRSPVALVVVVPLGVPLWARSPLCEIHVVLIKLPIVATLEVRATGVVWTIALSNSKGVVEFTRQKDPSTSEKHFGATP